MNEAERKLLKTKLLQAELLKRQGRSFGEQVGTGAALGVADAIGAPRAISDIATAGSEAVGLPQPDEPVLTQALRMTAQGPLQLLRGGVARALPSSETVQQFFGVKPEGGLAESVTRTAVGALPYGAAGGARGLVQAAVSGAGAGAGGEVAKQAGFGPVGQTVGAVAGAVTGSGVAAAGQRLVSGRPSVPTPDQLKTQATTAFKAVDESGVRVSPDSFKAFSGKLNAALKDEGINKIIHKGSSAAQQFIRSLTKGDLSLKQLEVLRRTIKDASKNPQDYRLAKMMINELDNYVRNLSVDDLVAGTPEQAAAVAQQLKQARELWGRYARSEIIETAVEKAELQASKAGTGGNLQNAIRQQIASVLNSKTKSRGFTPEELELMEGVVRGAPMQNLLRLVSGLSPTKGALMSALNIGAVAHDPAMAAFPAAGILAKAIEGQQTAKGIQNLLATIRAGGSVEPPSLPFGSYTPIGAVPSIVEMARGGFSSNRMK